MNHDIPELANWDEIKRLNDSALLAKQAAGIGKSLQNVTLGIVNSNHAIGGLLIGIGEVERKISELNSNIQAASVSSDNLTKAIKTITLWGTIIAGTGVLVAAVSLAFEIYKFVMGT